MLSTLKLGGRRGCFVCSCRALFSLAKLFPSTVWIFYIFKKKYVSFPSSLLNTQTAPNTYTHPRMRKAETSYRHTRQTLIIILWTIADTRQGCSAHVCSCLHSDRVSLSVLVASCHMACKSAMKRKARSVRKSTSKAKKPPRMTPDEKRIAREMHFERGMGRKDVATALGRDLSSICKLLKQKKTPGRIGPPIKFTEEKVDKMVKLLEKMVDGAEADYEVSCAEFLAQTEFSKTTILLDISLTRALRRRRRAT